MPAPGGVFLSSVGYYVSLMGVYPEYSAAGQKYALFTNQLGLGFRV
jgi:hypothetical protein